MNPVPSSVSVDTHHDALSVDSHRDAQVELNTENHAHDHDQDGDSPSAARKYIDAVLEQSFRHLFGPTATPEKPRRSDVVSIAKLTTELAAYLSPEEIKQVKQAFHFSDEAHLGQYRQSGEPYITHPVAVAEICASWKLDDQSIMAALLHDVIEDQGVTKTEIAERFGPKVAELVDGLSKLDKMEFRNREEAQAETSARCCSPWRATYA